MRFFAAALASVSIAIATAPYASAADLQLKDPTSQIENLTPENITAILTELGAQQIETHAVEGGHKLVTFKDGEVPFNLGFGLCDVRPGSCLALIMVVGFDPGTTHYPLELFNTFNRDNSFVSVVQLDGNKFAVSRMLFTDGGVSRKNVALNIANFAAAPAEVMKFLTSQLVAGYDQGSAAQFQRASLGAAQPRMVPIAAAEMVAIVKAQRVPARSTFTGK